MNLYMKLFFFPTSKNLEKYWFHRLIFPLYKFFVFAYILGVAIYMVSTVPLTLEYLKGLSLPDVEQHSWCSDYLSKWVEKYNEKPDYEQFMVTDDSISSNQKSLLKYLPPKKARAYASKLGGCLFSNKSDTTRIWVSDSEKEKPYELLYATSPTENFSIIGILFIGYLFGAIVPGLVYRYILYIFFGDKLNAIISSKK